MKKSLIALALVACAVTSRVALADPTPQERETARLLMDDGDERTRQSDFAGAVKSYEKAHAIMHVPTTGLELARAYERVGRLVDARLLALDVARIPKAPTEPPVFDKARADATDLAGKVRVRIATLTVDFATPDDPAAKSARITFDGKPLSDVTRGAPMSADPGKHILTVEADGRETSTTTVTVTEGERRALSLALGAIKGASALPVPAPTTAPAPPKPDAITPSPTAEKRGVSARTIALYGVGGAGLVAGIVGGVVSASKTSDLDKACVAKICGPDQSSNLSTAKTTAWVSNIGIGVAVVGGVLGTLSLFADRRADSSGAASSRTLTPVLHAGPEGGFLGVSGRL